jgi:Ca-activated chloride channel homolog
MRRTGIFLTGLVVCAVLYLSCRAFGQLPGKPLRVDLDLVLVNVGVTNNNNEVITGLEKEHFQIFEDKVEQKIEYFSTDSAPLSLGIIFDASHSMEKKMSFAKEAAISFLQSGTPEDEYFLVEFNNRAKVAADFTTDIHRLRDRLSLLPPEGNTAMYDAVYLGLNKVRHGVNPKKALLLITDGEDNHSRYSRGDIREFIREADVQIYSIDLGRSLIADLSEMTGGHSYRGSVDDLQDICEKIAAELKNQYVIGYSSSNSRRDGKWRKLQVKVTSPAGMPRLNVHAKEGYYGPQ